MNVLQVNKFSDLHNGETIFFCKTEYLRADFKKIKKLNHEVILISGNSDDGIDTELVSQLPGNVHTWYCQNNLTFHPKLRSIPIGLENTVVAKRQGHGIAWPHALSKVDLLNSVIASKTKNEPTAFLYANFNAQTNITHRGPIKAICAGSPFIQWDDPSLDYQQFISSVLNYQAVICPAGNGIDTHRLYEVLYCGRVAVTIKTGDYPIYKDLYEHLPVVILDNADELNNKEKLSVLITKAKLKKANTALLDFGYWTQLIKATSLSLPAKKPNFFKKLLNNFN